MSNFKTVTVSHVSKVTVKRVQVQSRLSAQHRLRRPNVLQVPQMHYQFQHQRQHHMETQA